VPKIKKLWLILYKVFTSEEKGSEPWDGSTWGEGGGQDEIGISPKNMFHKRKSIGMVKANKSGNTPHKNDLTTLTRRFLPERALPESPPQSPCASVSIFIY